MTTKSQQRTDATKCIAHVKLPESQRGSYAVQRYTDYLSGTVFMLFLFSPKTVQDLKNQSVSNESIWIQYQTMHINNNDNNNIKMVKITITNAYFTITF